MITSDNKPQLNTTSDEQFTEEHYRNLLCLAKASYRFVTYDAIPWGSRFVLWRHDLDYSINRAAALAKIEAEEGVVATYFVNPCSEFYNLFEPGQTQLIKSILALGHRIGLHFDASAHDIQDTTQLQSKVEQEGRWLEDVFGARPVVFSFHNPSAAHLKCEEDNYGGMINCYSRRFKTEIPYCSDSNGYWRFRRLDEVLTKATDPCLQVLTHPGWWQEKSMPPRQRIYRSAYGRAQATMNAYDNLLSNGGRINHAGFSSQLFFLRNLSPREFSLLDYLYNNNYFAELYVALFRIHDLQIKQLCIAGLQKKMNTTVDLNSILNNRHSSSDVGLLFKSVFTKTWQEVSGIDESEYIYWLELRDRVNLEISPSTNTIINEGSNFMCGAIEALKEWGEAQSLRYGCINHLNSNEF